MHRTLPALITLTLVACSSSGNTTTSSGSATAGGTGSASAGASSGGSQGTTTGARGPVTVENFNTLFNQAACAFVGSCQSGGADAPYYLSALCPVTEQFDFSALPLAVDAGRVFFDPAQAAACIAGLSSGVCSVLPILPCLPFLDGTNGLVPPAGACYANGDCLSGTCLGGVASNCTPGTCAGLVALGGSCDCANCGVCDPDAGLTCLMGTSSSTCVPLAEVGQTCASGGTSGAPVCVSDLACADGVCASLPIPPGNACDPAGGECTTGHYCFEKSGADGGNCANLVAAGQPCGEDADHQANAFEEIDNECAGAHPVCMGAGSVLDSGVVVPGACSEYSDLGGPCTPPAPDIDSSKPYNNGCYQELNCVGGACAKPPGSGKPCSSNGVACDPTTSYCVGATTTCGPFIALGGTCTGTDTDECGPSATCNLNNICQGREPSCSPTL